MEFVNTLYLFLEGDVYSGNKNEGRVDGIGPAVLEEVVQGSFRCLTLMLSPFAPYLANELWEFLQEPGDLLRQNWPIYNSDLAKEDEIEYAIQINGKLRGRISVPADSPEELVRERALADERVKASLEGKQVVKVIIVAGKLVNVVVR